MKYQHPSAGGGGAHFMEGVDIFLNFVAMVHGLQNDYFMDHSHVTMIS